MDVNKCTINEKILHDKSDIFGSITHTVKNENIRNYTNGEDRD